MTIRNNVVPYVLRVLRGNVRPQQLVSFARNRFSGRAEVMSGEPTHLSFFVTSRCNARCEMCPTHSRTIPHDYVHRHQDAPDMSVDVLRQVLNLFPDVIRVPLIGVGEPLLNPHLFDLVRECLNRQMIVDTDSNGIALDAFVGDIVRSGIDLICVSVNSHSAADFVRLTGNPAAHYPNILRNVEALVRARGQRRRKPRIELSFIVDRQNYSHMRDMVGVGEALGVDAVLFNHFLAAPFAGFTPEERCLYADDAAVADELAASMSGRYRCDVRWPYLLQAPQAKRAVCRWPFSVLTVDGAGNVGGCPRALLDLQNNGTVFELNAWNNTYFRDLRKRHLNGNVFWPCESCVEVAGIDPAQVLTRRR